jgi:hypothetical protein
MSALKAVNLLARFLLELCAVVAAGYWGFRASDSALEWLLGLGAPLVVVMLWGAFVAPKAPSRLPDPARLVLELAIFGVAAIALVAAGSSLLGVALAVAALANIGLMFALGSRGS